jgi:uncharacterized protein involved in tolerance to divalent cations
MAALAAAARRPADAGAYATMQTTANRVAEVIARATELHPYDTPHLLATPIVESARRYADWIEESTTSTSTST